MNAGANRKRNKRSTGYMQALAIFAAFFPPGRPKEKSAPWGGSKQALACAAWGLFFAGTFAQAQSAMEHDHGGHQHHHAAPVQPQASSPAPAAPAADPHAGHHHAGSHAESHAEHDGMQGGSAPPDARDPHAYSNGLKRGEGVYAVPGVPHLMMADEHRFASLRVDKLERRFTRKGEDSTAYEVQAWYGGTYDRLVIKTEGDVAHGKLEESRTELLWSHAISAYWDTQLGASLETGEGPNRQWLAFGVEGLAPYWFDVAATAYLGGAGRTALRLEASYDLLLTQELTLEPKIEMAFFGKNDPANQIGRGLAEASAGLRLRYEISPRFAPYIGVERTASFGRTADYIRADGGRAQQTRFVAGLRFWF